MERKIDAPDKDWLTKDEAAAYLRIKADTFQTLVDKGLIRGARKWTHRVKLWPWARAGDLLLGDGNGTDRPENLARR